MNNTNLLIAAELRRMASFLEKREAQTKPCKVELTNREDVKALKFRDFCEKYLKVLHPLGVMPFHIHEFQQRYVTSISRHRFVIGKKFRQGGFTTTTLAWFLRQAMFAEKKTYCVMQKTDREAIACREVVKRMVDLMPEFIRPELTMDNHHQMEFADTGSRILFFTAEAARGKSIDWLFMDEAAFWRNADLMWKAAYPTIAASGKCIVLSTPNGKGNKDRHGQLVKGMENWFYKTYTSALEGENEFEVFASSYIEHPEFQDAKRVAEIRKNLGEVGWRQEMLQEFLD